MDMNTLLSFDWSAMIPEFIIVTVAILLSLLDLFLPKKYDRSRLGLFGFIGVIGALVALVFLIPKEAVDILYGTFRLDSFAKAFKILLLVGTALVFLLAMNKTEEIEDRGEYYYLFLTALLGTMFMVSSSDLITLFVGLELLSLSSYILVAIRKRNTASNEGALKYVINGGISTAVTLFGLSYVYGVTGTTNINQIAVMLGSSKVAGLEGILLVAFVLVFVGLSFKLATVPFQMWAPDVYQSAATPVCPSGENLLLMDSVLWTSECLRYESCPETDSPSCTSGLLS